MRAFDVTPVAADLDAALRHKIDTKTKPQGALGVLEDIAFQVGRIQRTLTPALTRPAIVVFAADHGIARAGVSAYPPEVTRQMVLNFLAGGAAMNVFAAANGLELVVVDAGVDGELPEHPELVRASIGPGTRSFLDGPAMSEAELDAAFDAGARVVADLHRAGTNVVGFGEMGIGNTSSASLLMALFTDRPVESCIGPGTGLDPEGVRRKTAILGRARERVLGALGAARPAERPAATLGEAGGFEIAMLCGAALAAAERRMVVLVDGFIATAAILAGAAIAPALLDYCVFTHRSDEPGHRAMLEHLGREAVLDLRLRLGEGTGAALAYPVVAAAVAFLNRMASFESAAVSGRVDDDG